MMVKDLASTTTEDGVAWNPNYPVRHYNKMEICGHEHPIAFLKCKKCGLAISENDIDKMIEVLLKEKARLKKGRVVLLKK